MAGFAISPADVLKYTGPKRGIIPTVQGPRRPTVDDKAYPLQTIWAVDKNPTTGAQGEQFILVYFDNSGDAIWQQLALTASGGDLDTLSGDSGTDPVVPDGAGNIAVVGDSGQGVSTVGGTNQLQVTVQDATTVVKGVATFNPADFSVASGTVSLASSSIVLQFTGDNMGTATPTAGNVNVSGSNGLTTSCGGDTITIVPPPSAITQWVEVTGTSQALAGGTGYVMNNAGLVTGTLPAACDFGDVIRVSGKGGGGWRISQNAGQTIHFIDTDTTTGVGGYLASTQQYDVIELLCVTANTDFVVQDVVGNITIV